MLAHKGICLITKHPGSFLLPEPPEHEHGGSVPPAPVSRSRLNAAQSLSKGLFVWPPGVVEEVPRRNWCYSVGSTKGRAVNAPISVGEHRDVVPAMLHIIT